MPKTKSNNIVRVETDLRSEYGAFHALIQELVERVRTDSASS